MSETEFVPSSPSQALEAVDEPKDLGFGSVVGRENEKRLLNRDGTFNVEREGLRFWESLSVYHAALTTTWPRFLGVLAASYLGLNALFAFGFVLCGPGSLAGPVPTQVDGIFLRAFFFSVQTFATIGYGGVSPVGLAANLLVTFESLVGLLGFAIATGLLFARFSRPTGRIVFSRKAVIAPYRGITAFEFRITNARSNQLIELEAKVLYSRIEGRPGATVRKYDQLRLERTRVVFFPLSWTIVHPIDERSPLHGLTQEDLAARDAEFLVTLAGTDETFAQLVHTRSSYKAEDIAFGARFANMYNPLTESGVVSIDIGKLHDIEPADFDSQIPSETTTWHHTGHFAGFAPPRSKERQR